MYHVETTDEFDKWLSKLSDRRARAQIIARLLRVESGNFGDHKSVGGGISELRIHTGAGYRAYYTIRGDTIVFVLLGGDKSSQQNDIARAIVMKEQL